MALAANDSTITVNTTVNTVEVTNSTIDLGESSVELLEDSSSSSIQLVSRHGSTISFALGYY